MNFPPNPFGQEDEQNLNQLTQLIYQLYSGQFPPEVVQQANVQLMQFKSCDNSIKWLQHAIQMNNNFFIFYAIDCYCEFIQKRQLNIQILEALTQHILFLFLNNQFNQFNQKKMIYAISLTFVTDLLYSNNNNNNVSPLQLVSMIQSFELKLQILHEMYQLIDDFSEEKSKQLQMIMNNNKDIITEELIKTGNFQVIVVLSDCLTYSSTFDKRFLPKFLEIIEIAFNQNVFVDETLELFRNILIRGLFLFYFLLFF